MIDEARNIREKLASPKNIVLITHRNPDGDAIGSALGMYHYLKTQGHTLQVVFPSDYPMMFQFLEGIQECMIYDLHTDEVKKKIEQADVFFLLDFNGLDRIDTMGPLVDDSKAFKIMIDHHLDPEPIADVMISSTKASSTSELVCDLIEQMGDLNKLSKAAAEALFTGLVTDTGSFRYGTTVRTYQVAATLKNLGVDDYWLQNRIYNSLTEKQLRLIGHCLANRMEVIQELKTGIIYLNKEDYKEFNIQRGDTEGIVNYILMMRHIRVAVFITEQNQNVKLSFRSKGNISVQELARDFFNGGGHRNASGGQSEQSLDQTINYFKEVLPKYLEQQGIYT